MKRKIFINNQNKVIECQISVNESQIRSTLSYASHNTGEALKLVNLGKKLLTEKDKLRLSQTVRDLSEFQSDLAYDKAIKHQLIGAIELEGYDYDSILLSEEEMNDKDFLRRLRTFIMGNQTTSKDNDMELSHSFEKAVDKAFNEDNQLDQASISDNYSEVILNSDETKQYRLVMAQQLPYTKK